MPETIVCGVPPDAAVGALSARVQAVVVHAYSTRHSIAETVLAGTVVPPQVVRRTKVRKTTLLDVAWSTATPLRISRVNRSITQRAFETVWARLLTSGWEVIAPISIEPTPASTITPIAEEISSSTMVRPDSGCRVLSLALIALIRPPP